MLINFTYSRDGVSSCTISVEVPGNNTLDTPEERNLAYDILREIVGDDVVKYCVIAGVAQTRLCPEIWVMDEADGSKHIIGTSPRDGMYIDNYGNLCYTNLQNGEGAPGGEYKFIAGEHEDVEFSTVIKVPHHRLP